MNIYIYICIFMYICIFLYICTYMYIYVYTYTIYQPNSQPINMNINTNLKHQNRIVTSSPQELQGNLAGKRSIGSDFEFVSDGYHGIVLLVFFGYWHPISWLFCLLGAASFFSVGLVGQTVVVVHRPITHAGGVREGTKPINLVWNNIFLLSLLHQDIQLHGTLVFPHD